MFTVFIGIAAFGAVVGWCSSLALAQESRFGLAQLTALTGAIGGAAVTAGVDSDQEQFAVYCMGLAFFFFFHRFMSFPPVTRAVSKAIRSG